VRFFSCAASSISDDVQKEIVNFFSPVYDKLKEPALKIAVGVN
jgi:hypothetical protein